MPYQIAAHSVEIFPRNSHVQSINVLISFTSVWSFAGNLICSQVFLPQKILKNLDIELIITHRTQIRMQLIHQIIH